MQQKSKNTSNHHPSGIAIALTIWILWATTITYSLFIYNLTSLPIWQAILTSSILISITSHLYTGIFITAHDAMHGTVAPRDKRLNNSIGRLCVICYACFSYRRLLDKHKLHHQAPASEHDPDFAPTTSALKWYLRFMLNYLTMKQLIAMGLIHFTLTNLLGVSNLQTLLHWMLPMWLSTIQLFFFGTFLPHKPRKQPYLDQHCAWSLEQDWLYSLLSCYHFGGCHLEHHRFPRVPWWRLYQKRLEARSSTTKTNDH